MNENIPEQKDVKQNRPMTIVEAARAKDTEHSQETETPEDKKPFLEMARGQLASAIEALKAKVAEAFKKEQEGTEYNLVVAKVLAENAAKNLGEKLKNVDSTSAFAAVWFGIHALIYGGMTVWKVESLIPDQGTLIDGIRSYLANLDGISVAPPAVAIMSAVMSVGAAKMGELLYQFNKLELQEKPPEKKTKRKS